LKDAISPSIKIFADVDFTTGLLSIATSNKTFMYTFLLAVRFILLCGCMYGSMKMVFCGQAGKLVLLLFLLSRGQDHCAGNTIKHQQVIKLTFEVEQSHYLGKTSL
jgi:hypothetical protein